MAAPSDVKGFTNAAMAWMPKAAMERTVVSQVTLAHHFGFRITCRFKRHRTYVTYFGTKMRKFKALKVINSISKVMVTRLVYTEPAYSLADIH